MLVSTLNELYIICMCVWMNVCVLHSHIHCLHTLWHFYAAKLCCIKFTVRMSNDSSCHQSVTFVANILLLFPLVLPLLLLLLCCCCHCCFANQTTCVVKSTLAFISHQAETHKTNPNPKPRPQNPKPIQTVK